VCRCGGRGRGESARFIDALRAICEHLGWDSDPAGGGGRAPRAGATGQHCEMQPLVPARGERSSENTVPSLFVIEGCVPCSILALVESTWTLRMCPKCLQTSADVSETIHVGIIKMKYATVRKKLPGDHAGSWANLCIYLLFNSDTKNRSINVHAN
jgi:hypothetical protein